MHALINEIAKRLDLPPGEAEEAVRSIMIRVRAALETVGQAEIDGLGTFRLVDKQLTFEPAADLANEVNREFAGMKPVALTATGESVDVSDKRALPGVVPGLVESSEESPVQQDEEVEAVEPIRAAPASEGGEEIVAEEEPDAEETPTDRISMFESPLPPKPRKVRVPPSERRSSRRSETQGGDTTEIPDMGSIVTTRPVQPIHTGIPKRRSIKGPLFMAAAAIAVVAIASWWILGGSDDTASVPNAEEASVVEVPSPASEDVVAEEPVSDVEQALSPIEDASDFVTDEVTFENAPNNEASRPTTIEQPVEQSAEQSVEESVEQPVASAPETEVVEEQAQPPASGPAYAWIVASSPSRSEAESRADGLKALGFDAEVYEATVRGEPAFRVGVGRFVSEAEAWRNHDAVPPEATDAWITRVR